MFGLFVNAILADQAATRAGVSSGAPVNASPKLMRVLLYLAQHGGRAMTMSELAEGVGVSLGWASRVADELVSLNLLERARNDKDRRIVQLQLTPEAIATSARLWADRQGAIASALTEASSEDRAAIGKFLRTVTASLEGHASKTALGRF